MSVIFRKVRSSLANESPELPASVDGGADLERPQMRADLLAKNRVGCFIHDLQESKFRRETIAQNSRWEGNSALALPLRRREPLIRKVTTKMHFLLTGFSHNAGLRVFGFEGVAADQTRTKFSVSADIALSRRHGIRVQELPLLCLRLLEQHDTGDEKRDLTFGEEEMCVYASNCAAEREAAQRKRSPRLPPRNVATRTVWQYPQQRP
jgi:hypothetical protein